MRPSSEIERALEVHGDTVWRACCLYFSPDEAQDAYQETFLKYSLYEGDHADDEHLKAWLIRVAANVSKDMLRKVRNVKVGIDAGSAREEPVSEDASSQPASLRSDVVDALRSLPDPPRTPLYLSVCEEYRATEIADMLDAPVNTVYSWISRGKELLRGALS